MNDKQQCRLRVLESLKQHPSEKGAADPARLAGSVISALVPDGAKPGQSVSVYLPVYPEIDTSGLIRHLFKAFTTLYFPVMSGHQPPPQGRLDFVALSAGQFEHIRQNFPWQGGFLSLKGFNQAVLDDFDLKKAPDGTISACLVPCLGLNRERQRLGYGQGWYDDWVGRQPNRPRLVAPLMKFQTGLDFRGRKEDILVDSVLLLDDD